MLSLPPKRFVPRIVADQSPKPSLRRIVPLGVRLLEQHDSRSPTAHILPRGLRRPERTLGPLQWLHENTGFHGGGLLRFSWPNGIFPSSRGDRPLHFRCSAWPEGSCSRVSTSSAVLRRSPARCLPQL